MACETLNDHRRFYPPGTVAHSTRSFDIARRQTLGKFDATQRRGRRRIQHAWILQNVFQADGIQLGLTVLVFEHVEKHFLLLECENGRLGAFPMPRRSSYSIVTSQVFGRVLEGLFDTRQMLVGQVGSFLLGVVD